MAMAKLRLLATGCTLLLASAAEGATPSGVYSGDIQCRQTTVSLRLAVSELLANGRFGAVISYDAPGRGGRGRAEPSFRVKGRYTASTGEFQLQPAGWIVVLAGPGLGMFGLNGTYDAATDVVRGRSADPSCRPFELKRDAERTAQQQPQLEAHQQQAQANLDEIRNATPSAAGTGHPPEACLAILRWASRANEEYPDALRTETLGEVHPKFLNLFEDDYFASFFGKPLDRMTFQDLAAVRATLAQCRQSPRFAPQFQNLPGVGGAFNPVATVGTRPRREGKDRIPERPLNEELAKRRSVRNQFHETVDRLKALPGDAESYPKVVAMEKSRTAFAVLWPSELKLFDATLANAKRRSAQPLLASRVTAAIAAATGRNGILHLDQVAAESRELFLAVSPEAASAQYNRLAAALHSGLETLMAGERKRIDSFGNGVTAMEAGARWYKEFNALYLRVANDAAVEAALAQFKERRQRDLRASSALVAAEIRKAATPAELQATTARYVLESDRAMPDAAPVFTALVERRSKLARDQELLQYSEFERQHMVPNTLNVDIFGIHDLPAPTEREIALSVLRACAANGGTIQGPNTTTFAGAIVDVKRVVLSGCTKGDGLYDCRYKAYLHFTMGEGMREFLGKSIQADMLNARYEAWNSAEPNAVSDRFTVSRRGWFSPTLEQKILSNTLTVLQGAADDAKSVLCAKHPYDPGCR